MTEPAPRDPAPTYEDLATYAAWVLGSVEEAAEWLATPHPLLGDRPPVEVAAMPDGPARCGRFWSDWTGACRREPPADLVNEWRINPLTLTNPA